MYQLRLNLLIGRTGDATIHAFVHRAEVFGILRWLANNVPGNNNVAGYALRIPRFNAGAVNEVGLYNPEQCKIPDELYRKGRSGNYFGRFWLGNRDRFEFKINKLRTFVDAAIEVPDDDEDNLGGIDSADRYGAFEEAVVLAPCKG